MQSVVPRALDDGLDVWDPPPGLWAHTPQTYEDARRQVADVLAAAAAGRQSPRSPGGRVSRGTP